MEHFRIYPLSVITMQKLTDKDEILLEPIAMLSEALQEVLIKAYATSRRSPSISNSLTQFVMHSKI